MNEAEVACSGFVISCCEAARAFELVETSLDSVSQSICDGIKLDWDFAIGLAWNDRRSAAVSDCCADVVTVIAAVSQKHFGIRQIIIDQSIKALEIRDLTAGYLSPDRKAVSVGNEVDLGRKATF